MEQSQSALKERSGATSGVARSARLATPGEIDEALSKLNVWRMQLSVAPAHGDLQPFFSMP